MHIHAGAVTTGMGNALAIQRRIIHIAQSPLSLDYGAPHLPIHLAGPARQLLLIALGRLPGHVGERLINAPRLTGIFQPRVLLGKAVAHLMTDHIQRHQWIEGTATITEGHGFTIPEGILVVALVVNPHLQWHGQRSHTEPLPIEPIDHLAEGMGIVERRVGPIDRAPLIFVTGKGIGLTGTLPTPEIKGLHMLRGQQAFASLLCDVKGWILLTILIAPGLAITARTHSPCVGQRLFGLEDVALMGIQ